MQRRSSLSGATAAQSSNSLEQSHQANLTAYTLPHAPPTTTTPKKGNSTITLEMVYAEILSLKKMQKDQIAALQAKNNECEQKINLLEQKVNNLEQQLIANSIEIFNVPNSNTTASTVDLALKVFREGLNVSVKEDDIDHCYMKQIKTQKQPSSRNSSHSLGASNNTKKVLYVKFVSRNLKEKIVKPSMRRKQNLKQHLSTPK